MQSADARRVIVTGDDPVADGLLRGFGDLGIAAVRLRCDYESEPAVQQALVAEVGSLAGVDQIVHTWLAPGLFGGRRFVDIDDDEWAGACERSLEAAWWIARASAAPLQATGGSLVFVTPTIGMAGAAQFTMLATVAEGIRVLAKSCGRQWGAAGATVNIVAAAPHHWVGPDAGDVLHRGISLASAALGGAGNVAHDLAPLVALLADPGAHFLTASTLVADGGTWVGL